MATSSAFLDNYEPLDVIGNGSFGIIRKVRRKTDGLIFARKELNFERMTERDRKQIVAEVNILKDLHHDHIVRYHDRYVDRDAGILYILMEYCGGGDLSTIIKQAAKHNRPIPEDTIWHYFLQILLALHHCHHPNGHARSSSGGGSTSPLESEGNSRRVQILHRDLKPDNVFLDENNSVKLGDFGLSKALAQASFANTYVGTPYYMSPELMQEKAYDSKSDIWSLGCLIYELCALKPPFHEAKTHSELSIFIRNGRIPPLPRGYSQALTAVIKSMLNLNPAMRPSAAQLLQHERLELVFKVNETEKMLATVKNHRAAVTAKEREVLAREQTLVENEKHLSTVIASKDQEIASLQHLLSQAQHQLQHQPANSYSQHDMESAVKHAVLKREEELRVLVMKREEEVAQAIARREEEIMEAVRAREAEVDRACLEREELVRREVEGLVRREVEERVRWVAGREEELRKEEERLEGVRREVEDGMRRLEGSLAAKGRKDKNPLEEVKNLLEPLNRVALSPSVNATPLAQQQQQRRRKLDATPTPRVGAASSSGVTSHNPAFETPLSRPSSTLPSSTTFPTSTTFPSASTSNGSILPPPSAMKGVILTSTGQALATPAPAPAEILSLFERSPKVGLNFGRIFDFSEEKGNQGGAERGGGEEDGYGEEEEELPPSPTERKEREREREKKQREKSKNKDKERERDDISETSSSSGSGATISTASASSAGVDAAGRSKSKSNTSSRNQSTNANANSQTQAQAHPPTRIRRPSIRSSARSGSMPAPLARAATMPVSSSDPVNLASAAASSSSYSHSAGTASHSYTHTQAKPPLPLPHPHLRPSRSGSNLAAAAAAARANANAGHAHANSGNSNNTAVLPIPVPRNHPSPDYDFEDEDNLPSPFLRGVEREKEKEKGSSGTQAMRGGSDLNFTSSSSSSGTGSTAGGSVNASSASSTTAAKAKRRGSSGLLLRAVAAANSAGRRINGGAGVGGGAAPTVEGEMDVMPARC